MKPENALIGGFYFLPAVTPGQMRQNFAWREVACKSTGRVFFAVRLADILQAMRTILGGPLIVNSGYRSPSHNAAIGGSPNSYHTMGMAVDLDATRWGAERLIAVARQVGWQSGGHGIYRTFVHLDLGPARTWTEE